VRKANVLEKVQKKKGREEKTSITHFTKTPFVPLPLEALSSAENHIKKSSSSESSKI